MTDLILSEATKWLKQGIAVIPIQYRDKRPELKHWQPYQVALPTEDNLKQWFLGLHNMAVITGWQGLVVIDFDDLAVYSTWRLWATRMGSYTAYVADHTYQVKTGRGLHLYVKLPHAEQNRKLKGIDIKAAGGYVLAPPSVHPSGAKYQAILPDAPILPITALSDVLPADFLQQNTELPDGVIAPQRVQLPNNACSDDPWERAERADQASDSLVARIRDTFRVEQFFPQAIQSSADGRWMKTCCPFHDDRHPSFWIDTRRQICSCWRCTPKPLDVINLYGRLMGLSNLEAIAALKKQL